MRKPLVALTALVLLAGCGTSPVTLAARAPGTLGARADLPSFPMKDMTARRKKAITTYFHQEFDRKYDDDKDGKLTFPEWKQNYAVERAEFKQADVDKDGFLSFEEFLPTCENAWENRIRTDMGSFKILLGQADRNHDGKIAGKELVYKPNKSSTDYNVVDFNQDGEFTVDEYCDGYWNLMAGLKPAIPL